MSDTEAVDEGLRAEVIKLQNEEKAIKVLKDLEDLLAEFGRSYNVNLTFSANFNIAPNERSTFSCQVTGVERFDDDQTEPQIRKAESNEDQWKRNWDWYHYRFGLDKSLLGRFVKLTSGREVKILGLRGRRKMKYIVVVKDRYTTSTQVRYATVASIKINQLKN